MTIYDPPITNPTLNVFRRIPTIYDYYRKYALVAAGLDLKERLMRGDMWADGQGWVGPQPDAGEPDAARVMAMIQKIFVSQNIMAEVVTRHRDSVAGREPIWSLLPARPMQKGDAPTTDEAALIAEATAALTAWWDERQVWAEVQDCVYDGLWAGESPLRVYVPELHVNEDGTVPPGPLADVMLKVYAHHPEPTAAGVIRDLDRVPIGAYYRYADFWGVQELELQELMSDGRVQIRTYSGGLSAAPTTSSAPDGDVIEYDLGGLLLTHDLRLTPLVTPQIVAQQLLIGKAFSMLSRNIDVAGFLERTILNGQMPGEWVKDEAAPGGERFVPSPYTVGPGNTNWVNGIQYQTQPSSSGYPDAPGTQALSTPSIVYSQPVDVKTFLDTVSAARAAIYEEAKQAHMLIQGDATASGKSRVQATNDFVSSLEPTRIQLEFTVRWLLTTVLRLASVISGQPGRFDGLRVAVQARITAVQPDATMISNAILIKDAGLIDTEEAMTRVGVEDPDAMKARITADGQTPGVPVVPISIKGNAGATVTATEKAAGADQGGADAAAQS